MKSLIIIGGLVVVGLLALGVHSLINNVQIKSQPPTPIPKPDNKEKVKERKQSVRDISNK